MKVLGITETGEGYCKDRAYIVQITHDEVRKVANKGGYSEKLPELKLGEDYRIADGYDFRKEIVDATRSMQVAHERFAQAAATMTRFARLIEATEASEQNA